MQPTLGDLMNAMRLVQEAWEYDQDFYPDDDGWAGYSNEAKGELFDATANWPLEIRQQFAAGFNGRPEHAMVETVVAWESSDEGDDA